MTHLRVTDSSTAQVTYPERINAAPILAKSEKTGESALAPISHEVLQQIRSLTREGASQIEALLQMTQPTLEQLASRSCHLDTDLVPSSELGAQAAALEAAIVGSLSHQSTGASARRLGDLHTVRQGFMLLTTEALDKNPSSIAGERAQKLVELASQPSLQQALAAECQSVFGGLSVGVDVHALVALVIRQSYMEGLQGMYSYAEKVQFYNNLKKQIREEIGRARTAMQAVAGKEEKDTITPFATKTFQADYVGQAKNAHNSQEATLDPKLTDQIAARNEALAALGKSPAPRESSMATPGQTIKSTAGGSGKMWSEVQPALSTAAYDNVSTHLSRIAKGDTHTYKAAEAALLQAINEQGVKVSFSSQALIHRGSTWSPSGSGEKTLYPKPGQSLEDFLTTGLPKFLGELSIGLGGTHYQQTQLSLDLPALTVKQFDNSEVRAWSEQFDAINQQYPLASRAAGIQSADEKSASVGKDVSTKAQLDGYIQNLEDKLSSVGDDAQMANVDLQNMLQKQQQSLQMLSTIEKALHDTAMSVIRKMG